MKLKAIIVEDEANSREILSNYLAKYCPNVDLMGEAASIEEAKMLIAKHALDMVIKQLITWERFGKKKMLLKIGF